MRRNKIRSGTCFRCGASIGLVNCTGDDLTDPCPDCGQCSCLRRYSEDYKPETSWVR